MVIDTGWTVVMFLAAATAPSQGAEPYSRAETWCDDWGDRLAPKFFFTSPPKFEFFFLGGGDTWFCTDIEQNRQIHLSFRRYHLILICIAVSLNLYITRIV